MPPSPYLVESLERRRLLFAGQLDPAFGSKGIATPVPGLLVVDVDAQSDGKTIVAGNSNVGTRAGKFVVARYGVNGALDSTFGTAGVVLVDFASTVTGVASVTAVAVQPDDSIVLAGTGPIGYTTMSWIVRLTPSGALDTTFGSAGYQELRVFDGYSDVAQVSDITLQRDGKILLVGSGEPDLSSPGVSQIGVARLNANGTFDTSFDGNGTRYISFDSKSAFGDRLAIDYSGTSSTNANYGKIYVLGAHVESVTPSFTETVAVVRLTTGGTLDNGFDSDGRKTLHFSAGEDSATPGGIVVQPTGRVVIACTTIGTDGSSSGGLMRLTATGALDTTFGSSGKTAFTQAASFDLLQNDAGYLIAPARYSSTQSSLSGFTSEGAADPRFGTSGTAIIDGIAAYSAELASDLRILLGGGSNGDVARLYDRGPATVSIGTFNPNLYEQNAAGSSFIVTRLERLSTFTGVYLNVSGTATPNVDYTGDSNIIFLSSTLAYVAIAPNQTFTTINLTPIDDSVAEGDEPQTFTLAEGYVAYSTATPTAATMVVRDNDIVVPSVTSATFQYETGPQFLTFTFSQNVGASLTDSDFTLTGPAGMPSHTFAYDASTNVAKLSFNGLLPDGDYTAKVSSAGVNNSSGVHLPADYTLPFWFVNGDANRDRRVNFTDLLVLASNYGATVNSFNQGNFDLDGSGRVNFSDLLILASHYGVTLAGTSAVALPETATSASFARVESDDADSDSYNSSLADLLV
ncbi:MAG: dockerin type I domain-containing protein [Tepidisphaeraceae bacterium]